MHIFWDFTQNLRKSEFYLSRRVCSVCEVFHVWEIEKLKIMQDQNKWSLLEDSLSTKIFTVPGFEPKWLYSSEVSRDFHCPQDLNQRDFSTCKTGQDRTGQDRAGRCKMFTVSLHCLLMFITVFHWTGIALLCHSSYCEVRWGTFHQT